MRWMTGTANVRAALRTPALTSPLQRAPRVSSGRRQYHCTCGYRKQKRGPFLDPSHHPHHHPAGSLAGHPLAGLRRPIFFFGTTRA